VVAFRLQLAEHVGRELEAAWRCQAIIENKMAEPRDDALSAARSGDPPILFAARKQVAADVEAPHGLVVPLRGKTHLRKRDSELGVPSLSRLQCRDFPHTAS